MTRIANSGILLLAIVLVGCGAEPVAQPELVGGDRDKEGCIGSAGYEWCEATGKCERPWELAEQEGFGTTPEGFNAFCNKL